MGQKVTDFNEATTIEDTDFSWLVRASDGTDKKISWANLLIALGGRVLGEYFYLNDYTAPSASFPALCLSTIDGYTDISSTNWSSLVTQLRAKKLYYERGKTAEESDFSVTNWDITSNVATLTFSDTTAENAILAAMLEDEAYHGSYTAWKTITLPADIGTITAGDYAITAIDTTARTVKFAFTAANGSAAVTSTATFYPHRIAGSTTTARVFEADGLVLATAGASGTIAGLRTRDQMQGHWHELYARSGSGSVISLQATGSSDSVEGLTYQGVEHPTTDGTNGTPRTGTTTRERRLGAHLYIWARDYAA